MAVAISGPTEAQPPEGFQGARWGMSIQQVQSAFGGHLIPFTPPGGDASLAKFGIPDYDIDGCKLDLDFKFENERLVRMRFHFIIPHSSDEIGFLSASGPVL